MKKTLCIIITVLMLFTLVSCGDVSVNDMKDGNYSESYPGGAYDTTTKGDGDVEKETEEGRKIIKTVDENVQTDSYDDFIVSLKNAVEQCSGYIENASYSGNSYYDKNNYRNAYFVIRIPADKLGDFTKNVESLAVVTSYNESIKDVTLSYVDIESRITVLEAEETALLEILSKAESVNSMLSVRAQLNDVQSNLASLRAQKKAMDDKISYSTVNLRVNEVRVVTAVEEQSFFDEVKAEFGENLYNIGQGFRSFGVWFLGNSLYILMFAAFATVAFFVIRKLMKEYNRRFEEKRKQFISMHESNYLKKEENDESKK